jgi:hypothetical protein
MYTRYESKKEVLKVYSCYLLELIKRKSGDLGKKKFKIL